MNAAVVGSASGAAVSVDAPTLAHLVSILSLTGIVDALQGDGLAFNDFDVPFVLNQGVIDIKDAKATGLSLGYTAKGRIYTHAEIVDIASNNRDDHKLSRGDSIARWLIEDWISSFI